MTIKEVWVKNTKKGKIVIRLANMNDLGNLVKLFKDKDLTNLFGTFKEDDLKEYAEMLIEDSEVLVASHGNDFIACGSFSINPWVAVGVKKDFRRLGICTALLYLMLKYCKHEVGETTVDAKEEDEGGVIHMVNKIKKSLKGYVIIEIVPKTHSYKRTGIDIKGIRKGRRFNKKIETILNDLEWYNKYTNKTLINLFKQLFRQ